MNLATIIDNHPDDSVALISRGRTVTYGTLRGDVAGLRGGFVSLGLALIGSGVLVLQVRRRHSQAAETA